MSTILSKILSTLSTSRCSVIFGGIYNTQKNILGKFYCSFFTPTISKRDFKFIT